MVDRLPLVLVVAAFALHLLGEHRAAARTGRPRDRRARRRALTFYAALLTILIALTGPLDALAGQLFWVHMIQHLLLLVVAAPLIVLSRPWMSLWRPFPLRWRRSVAWTLARSPSCAPIRGLSRALTRPPGAWVAFNVSLVFWHLPGPYDLTLQNTYVHILEHSTFLLFGILFWAQVTKVKLPYALRIGYIAAAMLINVGLSIFLAFAQHPLYGPYAQLAYRPGGISALADQQIGAGIMWSAGDLPFAIAIALLIQRWLASQEAMATRLTGLAADPTAGVTAGQPEALAPGSADGIRSPSGDRALAPPLAEPPATGGRAGPRQGGP
jgi:putative membrane protein